MKEKHWTNVLQSVAKPRVISKKVILWVWWKWNRSVGWSCCRLEENNCFGSLQQLIIRSQQVITKKSEQANRCFPPWQCQIIYVLLLGKNRENQGGKLQRAYRIAYLAPSDYNFLSVFTELAWWGSFSFNDGRLESINLRFVQKKYSDEIIVLAEKMW